MSYKPTIYVPLEFSIFSKLSRNEFFKNRKMRNPGTKLNSNERHTQMKINIRVCLRTIFPTGVVFGHFEVESKRAI